LLGAIRTTSPQIEEPSAEPTGLDELPLAPDL
jgi:hypothetical protein